jgi:hypothetical protein
MFEIRLVFHIGILDLRFWIVQHRQTTLNNKNVRATPYFEPLYQMGGELPLNICAMRVSIATLATILRHLREPLATADAYHDYVSNRRFVMIVIAVVGLLFAALALNSLWLDTRDEDELHEMGIHLERGPAMSQRTPRPKRRPAPTQHTPHPRSHAAPARGYPPVHPV